MSSRANSNRQIIKRGYEEGVLYLVHGDEIGFVDEEDGDVSEISGFIGMLEPGTTYILATRYDEKNGWHTLITHPNGITPLSQNTGLGGDSNVFIEDDNDRIVALREAYKDEILLDVDVANDNARNSYASLRKSTERDLGEVSEEEVKEEVRKNDFEGDFPR